MGVMVRTSFLEVSKRLVFDFLGPTVYFYQLHHPHLCDLLHRSLQVYLQVQEIRINTKTEMGMLLLWMAWIMAAGKKVWDAGHLVENPRRECPVGKQILIVDNERMVTSGTENGEVLLVWTICGDPSDASIVNIKEFQLYFLCGQIHSIILLIIHLHI